MKLKVTKQALGDIIRLREFIAQRNPNAAIRISAQLIENINCLVDQSELGHGIETLPKVREWIARDYVVHYFAYSETLIELQVWHGK